MKNFFFISLTALCLSIALISCSNGGSYSAGGNDNNNQPSEVGCGSMQGSECDMFVAINQYRSVNGLLPYRSLGKCVDMAQAHATDMFVRNYFDHNSSTQSFEQRLVQYGLSSATATESIARGSNSPDVILGLLEKSTLDNQALLDNSEFHSIGVGFDGGYWTICYTALQ